MLLLHEVALELITTGILRFLETSLSEIRRCYGLTDSWPAEADFITLSQLAGGLFIFAASAVKFIGDKKYSDPSSQLEILTSKAASRGSYTLLDNWHLQVLDSVLPEVSENLSTWLKSVLGSIVLIKGPLPRPDLFCLIGLQTGAVYSSLSGIRSVLVPESEASTAILFCEGRMDDADIQYSYHLSYLCEIDALTCTLAALAEHLHLNISIADTLHSAGTL